MNLLVRPVAAAAGAPRCIRAATVAAIEMLALTVSAHKSVITASAQRNGNGPTAQTKGALIRSQRTSAPSVER
ncbi:hypothetical protein GCM10027421_22400 [Microbacterium shaanxiense]